jgi:hypothetical protein
MVKYFYGFLELSILFICCAKLDWKKPNRLVNSKVSGDSRWNDGKERKKCLWPLVINIIFILKIFEPFGHKLWLVTICHHDIRYNCCLS